MCTFCMEKVLHHLEMQNMRFCEMTLVPITYWISKYRKIVLYIIQTDQEPTFVLQEHCTRSTVQAKTFWYGRIFTDDKCLSQVKDKPVQWSNYDLNVLCAWDRIRVLLVLVGTWLGSLMVLNHVRDNLRDSQNQACPFKDKLYSSFELEVQKKNVLFSVYSLPYLLYLPFQ